MTDLTDEDVAFIGSRLDQPYTDTVAREIAAAVAAGETIVAVWQPGDGTRYELVVVPARGVKTASPRPDYADRRHSSEPDWGQWTLEGDLRGHCACLAIPNWSPARSLAVDFQGGGFWYPALAEAFSTTLASGFALAILLNLVSTYLAEPFGVPVEPEVAVDAHLEAGYEDRIMGDPADA